MSFAAFAALGGLVAGVSPDGLFGSLVVLGKLEPATATAHAAAALTPDAYLSPVTAVPLRAGPEPTDRSVSGEPGPARGTGGGLRIGVLFSAGMVAGLTALGGLMGAAGHVVLRYDLARWLPVVTLLMGLRLLGVLRLGWLHLPTAPGPPPPTPPPPSRSASRS